MILYDSRAVSISQSSAPKSCPEKRSMSAGMSGQSADDTGSPALSPSPQKQDEEIQKQIEAGGNYPYRGLRWVADRREGPLAFAAAAGFSTELAVSLPALAREFIAFLARVPRLHLTDIVGQRADGLGQLAGFFAVEGSI